MFTLAVVGSVDLSERQYRDASLLVRSILEHYDWKHYDHFTVVSGGAAGIDSLTEALTIELDLPFNKFLPEKQEWEFFKKRNKLIAETCDHLIMVRSKQSKTYGSGWTADYAEEIGKEVFRYYV